MGKNKHDIHKCFRDESVKEGKKTIQKKVCNFCSWTTFPNATRQKQHILKCINCPSDIKDNLRKHGKYFNKSSTISKYIYNYIIIPRINFSLYMIR